MNGMAALLRPDAISASSIARARRDAATQRTPFGPLMQTARFDTTSHGVVELPIQAPLPMLWIAMSASARFARYVRDAIDVEGMPSVEKPWRIAFYCDQVTVGAALRTDNRRKIEAVYWSIVELGALALGDELCWFEIASFRTSEVLVLESQMSHVLEVCALQFFDTAGFDLRTGLAFDVMELGMFLLFAIFGMFIADVKALVEVVRAMGPTGVKCCFLCHNVISKQHWHTAAKSVRDVCVTELDLAKCGCHSNASLASVFQLLSDQIGVMSSDDFPRLQTRLGYKHGRNLVLNADLAIKVIDTFLFDFMHLFFVGGCFNLEAFALLHALVRARKAFTYNTCLGFLERWIVPKHCPTIKGVCTKKHLDAVIDAKSFKCTASEGLTIYPLMHKFCADLVMPNGLCEKEVKSFILMCQALDLLVACKCGKACTPEVLHRAILKWLVAHKDAYGDTLFKPKHHYTLHLAAMLRRFGLLPGCWVQDL